MSPLLRVLHLEDNRDYSALVESKLAAEGFKPELVCVETRDAFEAALKEKPFDIIIADYFLPTYDGLKALKLAREKSPHTPILLVSGTIGEEAAVESLRAGADDYVLKHWPERLVPAVRRALREAEHRRSRVQAETALVRSEKLFRALSENALDIVTILDREGNYTYNSPSITRALGYQLADLVGRNAFTLIHTDDSPKVREAFEKVIAQPGLTVTLPFRFRHQDGSWHYLESIGQSLLHDPDVAGVVVNSRDVTDRQRAEQYNSVLSKLGRQLSSVTTAREAAKVIVETADSLFPWDACFLNLYSPEDDRIQPVLTIDTIEGRRVEIPDDEIQRDPSERTRRILRQGAELILREEPIRHGVDAVPMGDKTHASASLMFVPIRSPARVIGVLSLQSYQLKAYSQQNLEALQTLADYCGGALERIRVERALRESESRFHSVWENSVDGMRLTDEEGNIVAVNEAFAKLVGMTSAELEGKPFTVVYADGENVESKLASYMQRFSGRTFESRIDRQMAVRSGRILDLEVASSFVELRGQKPLLLSLFRDMTEQKRLQDQLRQSQKMDAIGQLAGGVAHDFNNILTVILGHAALLRAYGKLPEMANASAEQISQAAERAAGLTRQLLTFSRRQVMQPRQLDLNEVVSHMTRMLGRILGEDIKVQFNYSSTTPLVHADVGMLEQVLLNLAVNSRDAMPLGGRLTINISVLDISSQDVAAHPGGRAGSFVCLSVIDTGCGIEPENLPRIFEPFFTTKEVGKGTGLGLATVYGIVKQHEGWIEVATELNAGTTFRVFLPASDEPAASADEASSEISAGRGTETILVVEDEAPVRELVCNILRTHGYHVLEADCGNTALAIWREQRDRIDLLLTDLVMPDGMTGRDLAARAQSDKPGLKAIFTSGYSADIIGKDFVLQEGLNFLQKPYHPHKLAAAVRKCLEKG
jgi:two-component system, cell cycle sensor histidine kinase and response regulator CckA